MTTRKFRRHTFILLFSALVALLPLLLLHAEDAKSHDMAVQRNMSIFNSLVKQLETTYVDTINTDRAFKSAIGAFLSEVDPYTEFYTPDDFENFIAQTSGEYGGVGSYIMARDGAVYISGPYENSPAERAGLKSGDRILKVDSTDFGNRSAKADDVTRVLRGQPGTIAHVTVQRPYASPDSILEIEVMREKMQVPSVSYYGVTRENLGYIRLTQFIATSAEEVRKALTDLTSNPAVKGIVLDLRGNGGGLVESSVEICGMFLPKGTQVLTTRGRGGKVEKIYKTIQKPIAPDIPLAVLIDGGTASASEILAGSMQDLDRAVLIGTQSFGKGLVQSTFDLPYDHVVKITRSKYYIPSGRLIQALDYSRRNPDGSVARTPDSLTNVYHTAAGREVRDGGGLKPDIVVTWKQPSGLTFALMRDNIFFDYATLFVSRNKTIAPAEQFFVTDEIFDDFVSGVDPARVKYTNATGEYLDVLDKYVKQEGYMTDEIQADIDSLRSRLNHDLKSDLLLHRDEVKSYICSEIMDRYYHQKGVAIEGLRDDVAVDSAAQILLGDKYNRLLKK